MTFLFISSVCRSSVLFVTRQRTAEMVSGRVSIGARWARETADAQVANQPLGCGFSAWSVNQNATCASHAQADARKAADAAQAAAAAARAQAQLLREQADSLAEKVSPSPNGFLRPGLGS